MRKQKLLEQKQQQYYKRFVDSKASSPQTQKKYIIEFNCYLKYLKVQDPNTLITEELLDSPKAIRVVEDQITKYLQYLSEVEKLSYATIHVRAAAIIYFYTINRVNLDSRHIGRFKPNNRKIRRNDKAYSHGQISQMLDCADLRERVMVLLLCSAGLRIGALPLLTIGSLQKVKPEGYLNTHLYKIVIYQQEQEEHYSFCSFECAKAIDSYLEFRKEMGEALIENTPLIREDFDTEGRLAITHPKSLNVKGFKSAFVRLVKKSGIRVKKDSEIAVKKQEYNTGRHLYEVPLTHGMRKFAITQFKKAQVDFNDREYFVGHKTSRGLDRSYDRTSEEDRLSEYLKATDLLTIDPTNRLRKQVAEQEHTIQVQMAQKDSQIEKLMKRVDMLEGWAKNPELLKRMRDNALGRK